MKKKLLCLLLVTALCLPLFGAPAYASTGVFYTKRNKIEDYLAPYRAALEELNRELGAEIAIVEPELAYRYILQNALSVKEYIAEAREDWLQLVPALTRVSARNKLLVEAHGLEGAVEIVGGPLQLTLEDAEAVGLPSPNWHLSETPSIKTTNP